VRELPLKDGVGGADGKNPLFSTHRQGQNRVTSSMLAIFERIDLSLLETILAAAAGESSLQMVSFYRPAARQGLGSRCPDLGKVRPTGSSGNHP
jgi:hypothetical protein